MKNRKPKLLVCMLAAGMLAMQAASCGDAPDASSNNGGQSASGGGASRTTEGFQAPDHENLDFSGDYIKCKDTVTLTLGIAQNPLITDYKDNKYTKWLEETCNLDLQFDYYPQADASSKIRILISSGSDMPDIFGISAFASLDVYNYGTEGAIVPLEDYVDSYSKYYKPMLETDKNYRKILTMPDGHIYAFPDITESLPNNYSQRAYINKKWLDSLGLEMPGTTDELYEVLKAFVTKDPNGNGKPDEIGLAGSSGGWREQAYNWLMNAFIYDSYASDSMLRLNVADDGGSIYTPVTTDEWRAGLSYMNKLCEEGLYSPLAFTQDGQQFKAMCNTEDGSLVGLITAGGLIATGDDQEDYVPIGPMKGPEGVCWAAYFPTAPTTQMILTSACKTPGAAFALCDAMLSEEGSIRSRFGEPGIDCVMNDDGSQKSMLADLGYDAVLTPTVNWGAETNLWWNTPCPTYRTFELIAGQAWDGNPKNGQYLVCQAVPYYYEKQPEKVVNALVYTQDEADEIRDPQNTICTYTKESIARFITGDADIDDDAAWNAYLKELDSMGLPRVMEINQAVYDRMYN